MRLHLSSRQPHLSVLPHPALDEVVVVSGCSVQAVAPAEAEVVVGLVCSVVQACIVAYEEKPV